MILKPTGSKVAVEPLALPGEIGGIHLPPTHNYTAALRQYVVKATGPQCVHGLQPGNVVLASPILETKVSDDRCTIVCEESELLAVLTE